jgi:hypothetical protein
VDQYQPFFGFLLKIIDAPLNAIGMSKSEFFSFLLIVLAIARPYLPPGWTPIIEPILLGGLGLGISHRLQKMQQQVANEGGGTTDTTKKYW